MAKYTPNEKKLFADIKALKEDYKRLYNIVKWFMIILILLPLVFFVSYWVGEHHYALIHTSLTLDGILAFYGGFLAFVGTVSLGALTVWQSIRANKIQADFAYKQLQLNDYLDKAKAIEKLCSEIENGIKGIDTNLFNESQFITKPDSWIVLLNKLTETRKSILQHYDVLKLIKEFKVAENCVCSECYHSCALKELSSKSKETIFLFREAYHFYIDEYIIAIDEISLKVQGLLFWTQKEELTQRTLIADQDKIDSLFKDHVIYEVGYQYTQNESFITAKDYVHQIIMSISKSNNLKRDILTYNSEVNKKIRFDRDDYLDFIKENALRYNSLIACCYYDLFKRADDCKSLLEAELGKLKQTIMNFEHTEPQND